MNFTSTDGTQEINNTGDTFVDDVYLGATSTYTPEDNATFTHNLDFHRESAVANLQQLSQKWEKLLFSTGWEINIQKIFLILIILDFIYFKALFYLRLLC